MRVSQGTTGYIIGACALRTLIGVLAGSWRMAMMRSTMSSGRSLDLTYMYVTNVYLGSAGGSAGS